jgi:hypothetical protein
MPVLHRMRTINFTFLAVLIGSIAMIGAIPVEDGSLVGSIAHREAYAPLQQH